MNPDVFAVGVKTEDDDIQHYTDIGYIERRSSNPLEKKLSGETLDDKLKLFNWRFYVKNNEDLSKAGMKTLKNAVKHYISTGYFEKRPCSPKEPIAAIATADKNKDYYGSGGRPVACNSMTKFVRCAGLLPTVTIGQGCS